MTKPRVLLVGKNGRIERIDVAAIRQFGGLQRLLYDLAKHEEACAAKRHAQMMRPTQPSLPS